MADVETALTIASRRETRRYGERPIPPEVERAILDAGRLAGSSKNKQPWRFLVVESPEILVALAEVYRREGKIAEARMALEKAIKQDPGGPVGQKASEMLKNLGQ